MESLLWLAVVKCDSQKHVLFDLFIKDLFFSLKRTSYIHATTPVLMCQDIVCTLQVSL